MRLSCFSCIFDKLKIQHSGDGHMKTKFPLFVLAILLLTLTGCTLGSNLQQEDRQIQFTTPGPNPAEDTKPENGPVAGLGTGLFHGLISVITLIISFMNPDVQMYEVHNNGPLYN